ncbi:hypothetical protein E0H26_16880 [Micromonospora zingiberis]|uniref:Extradiol ring-cleavage dioxygenase class III enzyme subunit B domain-containing protein n=1 Tax=Micromonospora zingiberis TaxID=2053011 RepID=A0A4R0GLA6_9ACTN|nr:class III extradiol dioxygenase subunit B-like domain-containing protein [Micromonospora zingiberis]TCB96279.1 hypothetical protein E0H26_16880 [Micromonospora zingiberis]
MPLVAAAVCPHPPLLVPEVAGAAAMELDDLRRACDVAVARLLDSGAAEVLVVGAGPQTRRYDPPFHGSLAPYGLPVEVAIGALRPDSRPELPLSLTIGTWLLGRVRPGAAHPVPPVSGMYALARETDPAAAVAFGADGADDRDWALLVLGDGSACRGERAPGYTDPRAEAYDSGVARALADVDLDALLGLDADLSAQLQVAGRAPWQALAGAVRAAGGDWRGELSYHAAPYGVAYFVASWERA